MDLRPRASGATTPHWKRGSADSSPRILSSSPGAAQAGAGPSQRRGRGRSDPVATACRGRHGQRDRARRPRSRTPGRRGATPPVRPDLPRLRPRAAGARTERGRGGGHSRTGAGGRGRRHVVDRLAFPGDATRPRRRPGRGAVVRSLRARRRPAAPAPDARRARRHHGCRPRRHLGRDGPRRRAAGDLGSGTRSATGTSTSSGPRRGTRYRRWPRRWSGAGDTCRPSASRSCCGATSGWATSSSTASGRWWPSSTGTWRVLGPREMDLGWHVGLDHMMETLFGRRVPGFPDTAESVARYERRSGYEVRDLGVARGLRAGAGARHKRPPPADTATSRGGPRIRWPACSWTGWRPWRG